MAKILRSLIGDQVGILEIAVNTNQTIIKGDLLVISSGKISKAGEAATAIIGLAASPITTGGSVTSDDKVPVEIITNRTVLEFSYSGTFTAADMFGDAVDFDADGKIDPADTTGGWFVPISFNASKELVQGIIQAQKLWNGILTGNIAGDITGDLSGDVTGDLTGKVFSQNISSYSATGVIAITDDVARFDASGGALAMSLPDGVDGQVIELYCLDASNNVVITPVSFDDGTTITLDTAGDYAKLIFDVDGWKIVFSTATIA